MKSHPSAHSNTGAHTAVHCLPEAATVCLRVRTELPAAVRWSAELTALLQTPELPERLTPLAALSLETSDGPRRMADLFEIEGPATATSVDAAPFVRIEGDCRSVQRLGRQWSAGRLEVHGAVGPAAGERFSGGELFITGDVGPGLGRSQRGGRIQVHGSAQGAVGSPAAGERHGMTGGELFIHGDVHGTLGERMRRGTLVVSGHVQGDVGREMRAGTILLHDFPTGELGHGLKRGTILCLHPPEIRSLNLAGRWRSTGRVQPVFWRVLARYLNEQTDWPHGPFDLGLAFERYSGDLLEGARGEFLLRLPN